MELNIRKKQLANLREYEKYVKNQVKRNEINLQTLQGTQMINMQKNMIDGGGDGLHKMSGIVKKNSECMEGNSDILNLCRAENKHHCQKTLQAAIKVHATGASTPQQQLQAGKDGLWASIINSFTVDELKSYMER